MRTVRGLQLKYKKDLQIKEMIYNDSSKDFSTFYAHPEGGRQLYKIKAGEILKDIPKPIAKHIRKHLVDHIMISRDLPVMDGKERNKVYKDTQVEV